MPVGSRWDPLKYRGIMRYGQKLLLTLATLQCGISARALGQTAVYTTFGPASTWLSYVAFGIYNTPYVAASFTFGGPSSTPLSEVRAALAGFGEGNVMATFWEGPDMSVATPLEGWVLPLSVASVYSFPSVLRPVLGPGTTYWLSFTHDSGNPLATYWYYNDQGIVELFGATEEYNPGNGTWRPSGPYPAPAWAVIAGEKSDVVPEPTTAILLGTGLLGIAGSCRNRRIS